LGRLTREQRLAVLDPARPDAYPVAPGYAPGEHHFPYDYARTPDSSQDVELLDLPWALAGLGACLA
ncbi:hypothetical protein ABZS63_29320, partial [Streptomyces sp. NPDC005568]